MKTYQLTASLAGLFASLHLAQADVRYLGHGHTDLAIGYDATTNAWSFHVGSDTLGTHFALDEVILKVKPGAQTTVPSDPKFAFLGMAGAPVWILPQAQNEELLYLGYNGDDVPVGILVSNQVQVILKSVTGPGNFFSYRVQGFGAPEVLFDSTRASTGTNVATVQQGGDAHLNWAFTQPGDYTVTIQLAGTFVAGNKTISSRPFTFKFNVGAGPSPDIS
jgi:surface-anchored protein